eukprot:7448599-Lingulodinium_polyedra.AAC.1
MHGVAATECMSERISEQLSRESCSEMCSETHSVVAAVRKSHALRAPCKHQRLVFAWCARGVLFASRCGGR